MTTGPELLPNPSFTTDASCWTLTPGVSGVSGSRDTNSGDYDTVPACYLVTSGSTAPTSSTKLTTQGTSSSNYINVVSGQMYELSFRAKYSGTAFTLPSIQLQNSSGTSIGTLQQGTLPTFTTSWTEYDVFINATSTATNAKIVFTLGGGSGMKTNTSFYIDTLSFQPELLPNPSFYGNANDWGYYFDPSYASGSGARSTSGYDSSPGCYELHCTTDNTGTDAYSIQLETGPFSITTNQYYQLTFRAKCTIAFNLPTLSLGENGPPYTFYGPVCAQTMSIGASYQTYTVLFRAWTTASDARITFALGNGALPAGANFYLDTLSLRACTPSGGVALMDSDVGNIIYNNDSCAYKRFVLTDQGSNPDYYDTGLHNQGDFYYNTGNWTVEVYSTSNPASYYSDIEVARGDYVVVGLAIRPLRTWTSAMARRAALFSSQAPSASPTRR